MSKATTTSNDGDFFDLLDDTEHLYTDAWEDNTSDFNVWLEEQEWDNFTAWVDESDEDIEDNE